MNIDWFSVITGVIMSVVVGFVFGAFWAPAADTNYCITSLVFSAAIYCYWFAWNDFRRNRK